jgi:hypothetical protein
MLNIFIRSVLSFVLINSAFSVPAYAAEKAPVAPSNVFYNLSLEEIDAQLSQLEATKIGLEGTLKFNKSSAVAFGVSLLAAAAIQAVATGAEMGVEKGLVALEAKGVEELKQAIQIGKDAPGFTKYLNWFGKKATGSVDFVAKTGLRVLQGQSKLILVTDVALIGLTAGTTVWYLIDARHINSAIASIDKLHTQFEAMRLKALADRKWSKKQ